MNTAEGKKSTTIGLMCAVAILTGACNDSDETRPTPREAPAQPTATRSPTPPAAQTPPVMRKQAREDSAEGAAAFVGHYIDMLNYAAATGDVAGLRRLSDPDCKGCQSYIKLYRDTYAAGGYFKGGEWRSGEMQLDFVGDETHVTTEVRTGGSRFRQDANSTEKLSRRDSTPLQFVVPTRSSDRKVLQFSLGSGEE